LQGIAGGVASAASCVGLVRRRRIAHEMDRFVRAGDAASGREP